MGVTSTSTVEAFLYPTRLWECWIQDCLDSTHPTPKRGPYIYGGMGPGHGMLPSFFFSLGLSMRPFCQNMGVTSNNIYGGMGPGHGMHHLPACIAFLTFASLLFLLPIKAKILNILIYNNIHFIWYQCPEGANKTLITLRIAHIYSALPCIRWGRAS